MSAKLEEIDITRNNSGSSVPLILIHDGGGTIFQYYTLGPLSRDVYGIANPYFSSGDGDAVSITDLASKYAEVIQKSFGSSSVIVGGECGSTTAPTS